MRFISPPPQAGIDKPPGLIFTLPTMGHPMPITTMKKLLLATLLATTPFVFAEDQVIEYPADEPIFSITFPEKWTVSTEDDSVSASSPDEEVNMELLALDAEAADEALKIAKETLAEQFEGIQWNGEPETGELNGMKASFLNAKVKIEDIEFAVNCAIFAPEDADTFFMLFNMIPMTSLEKHGEDVGKILNSVKAE